MKGSAILATLTGVVVAATGGLVAASGCANIAGLPDYSACSSDCPGGSVDASRDVSTAGDDGATAVEASSNDPSPEAAADSGGWACAKGGCNAAGGVCSGPGSCFCTHDGECPSGACVAVAGSNDVACGANCSGAGRPDGFGCALGSPGIPPSCTATAFGYTPSNFAATAYASDVPSSPTTLDCSLTYDASTHAFTACAGACTGNFCTGATPPFVAADVAQSSSGGPKTDVLVFAGLTVTAGSTLTIGSSAAGGGGNAVIFAVFGDASVAGTIRADGAPGTSGGALGTNTPGASGPGGNSNCTTSAKAGSGLNGGPSCSSASSDCRDSAGGGGAGSGGGGDGASGVNGNKGSGGSARANATLSPLSGGCPGGTSGGWACTTYGGGGGGAVQVSAAGTLTVTGTITANGGAGGSSTCSLSQSLCNTTYPGGAGGGGAGGAVLLEGQSVTTAMPVAVNGGSGGNAMNAGAGGAGGTDAAPAGKNGSGSGGACGDASAAGGGGGGGYGYLRVNATEPVASYACVTTLAPAPVCDASHRACLCVADADCASGKCVNSGAQCSGTCSGAGAADDSGCQLLEASPAP